MKRTLSLLLAVLLCFSCFVPAGAAAAVLTRSAPAYKTCYVLTKAVYNGLYDVTSEKTYTYDKNFNVTKSTVSDNAGTAVHTYSYDSYGRLVKETTKSDDGNTTVLTYKYGAGGNLQKETYRADYNGSYTNSYESSKTYTYDSLGRLKKAVDKDAAAGETYTSVYSYDANGNLKKYATDYLTVTYQYDAAGNVIKETGTNTYDPAYSYTYTYSYNSSGNLIKQVYKSAANETDTHANTFNTAGKIAKETAAYYSSANAVFTYVYGENGKVSKRIAKWADGSYAQYVYKYDSHGNNTKITYTATDGATNAVDKGTYTYTYKKVTNGSAYINDNVQLGYQNFVYRVGAYSTVYNGKANTPRTAVFNSYAGESSRLIKGRDYRVEYSNNKLPGKAQIKITFTFAHAPIVITFNIRPKAPTGLKAAAKTKTSVTLTWNKVTGAKQYIVYKYVSSTGKYVKLATVTTNKAVIKDLKANTAYQFCVRAVAAGGVSGALSAKLTVRTAK